MTDTRCHCTRHNPATPACSPYQAMNTAHLLPVLAAISRDYAELCERGTLGEIPTAEGAVPLMDLGAYLTCPRTGNAARDAVWRRISESCRRADARAETWKRAAGTISALEADLIGRHRIKHVTLRHLCTEHGWYPMQATRALRAAETKATCALGMETQH